MVTRILLVKSSVKVSFLHKIQFPGFWKLIWFSVYLDLMSQFCVNWFDSHFLFTDLQVSFKGLPVFSWPVYHFLWYDSLMFPFSVHFSFSLWSSGGGDYDISIMTSTILHPDGQVFWMPPSIFTSSCVMNVEFFPFDMQTCTLKFGSWSYDGSQARVLLAVVARKS